MKELRPYVLTIAGFDPCGGAGILADCKTFESLKTLGLAVCTANTIQVEDRYESTFWIDKKVVLDQLNNLLERYKINVVKIGLVHDFGFLNEIIDFVLAKNKNCKIIWDPILKATASATFFHENIATEDIQKICSKLFMITPNTDEVLKLTSKVGLDGAKELKQFCTVFLKGGHSEQNIGKDYLVTKDTIYPLNPKSKVFYPKHGSGCILSAALTALVARKFPLLKASLKAKTYFSESAKSNRTLLAYHKI